MTVDNPTLALETAKPRKSTVLAWVVCLTAGLFFFYEFIQMNMLDAISTDLMRGFGITAGKISLLGSVFFIANTVCLFPAGLLLDQLSARKVILWAMGLTVACAIGFALAPTFSLALFFRLLAGTTNAFCFLSCIIIASRWFNPKQMALVLSLIITIAMVGGVMAHTPLVWLTDTLGWRNAILIDGILGVIIWIAIWAVVKDHPKGATATETSAHLADHSVSIWHKIKLAIMNRQNWLCGIFTSVLNLPLMVLGGLWGRLYLQQAHHLTAAQATTVSSTLFIGTIFGSPLFGALSDRMERRRMPMVAGALLSIASFCAILYVPQLNFQILFVLFLVLGFFTAAQVIGYPTVAESNAPIITGTASSITAMIVMGGPALFDPIFGSLLDKFWDHTIVNGTPLYSAAAYHKALFVFLLTLGIGLIAALLTHETYCQPVELKENHDRH